MMPINQRPPGNRRVTLRVLAAQCRVSPTTVWRVLNGHVAGKVSIETTRRIQTAAAIARYEPRRRWRPKTIGLVLPDLADHFFAELAQQLANKLYRWDPNHRLLVVLMATEGDEETHERAALEALLDHHVDAIIAVPTGTDQQVWRQLVERHIPLVFVDRTLPARGSGHEEVPYADAVIFDDRQGAAQAVRLLLSKGHTRIGIITGPLKISTYCARLEGFRQAYEEARGLRPDLSPFDEADLVQECSFAESAREQAVGNLLNLPRRPTAILALGNLLGESVIRVTRQQGLRIPEDVSLITFDDARWTALTTPPLTVVSHPPQDLAQKAISVLKDLLSSIGSTPGGVKVGTHIASLTQLSPRLKNELLGSVLQWREPERREEQYYALERHLTRATRLGDRHAQVQHHLELAELDVRSAQYPTAARHLGRAQRLIAQLEAAEQERVGQAEQQAVADLKRYHLTLRGKYYGRLGRYNKAKQAFKQALALTSDVDPPGTLSQCELRIHLGKLAGNQGRYEEALIHLREGARLVTDTVPSFGLNLPPQQQTADIISLLNGKFLMHRGWVLGHQGNYQEAEAALQAGERLARAIQSDDVRSGILLNLGWIAMCRGDYQQAESYLKQGYELTTVNNLLVRQCGFLENLSMVAWCRGEYSKAETLARQGLHLARQVEHSARICGSAETLSWVLITQGKDTSGLEHLERALQFARAMNYPVRICSCLQTQGWALLRRGRLAAAEEILLEAETYADHIDHRFLHSSALVKLGELYLAQGDLQLADRTFHQAHGIACNGIRQQALEGQALYGLARVAKACGHRRNVRRYGEECLQIFTRIGFNQEHTVKEWLETA